MTKTKATAVLMKFVWDQLNEQPAQRQVEVYQALELVAPTEAQRRAAGDIAFAMTNLAKLQLEFFTDLLEEGRWPGHQHNGPGSEAA